MSELKAFVARKIDDGTCDPVPCVEVYLKSEADKVIADLEESHKKEVGQLLIEIVELKDKALQYKVLDKEHCRDLNTQERFFAKQIAHQKFKRCVSMAKMCGIMSAFEDGEWYAKWINKWYKRWLEIADKYKEEA